MTRSRGVEGEDLSRKMLSAAKYALFRHMSRWFLKKSAERWRIYPFGTDCLGSHADYSRLFWEAETRTYPNIDNYERELGYEINRAWLAELALHTQVVIKASRLCYEHGRVLYSCLSDYVSRHQPDQGRITIVETGTARGFSALCMAKALADADRQGLILTFDVLPHNVPMMWNCIDDLDKAKTRGELLAPWDALVQRYVVFVEGESSVMLSRVQVERINFAFIDAMHTEDDVLSEFQYIQDKQRSGDVVVFDDYSVAKFPEVVRTVDQICIDFAYDARVVQANRDRGYLVATRR